MDKKAWVKELVKLADELDQKGLGSEAAELDSIVKEAIMVDPLGSMDPKGENPIMTRRREDVKNLTPEQVAGQIQFAQELSAIALKVKNSETLTPDEQVKWDKYTASIETALV